MADINFLNAVRARHRHRLPLEPLLNLWQGQELNDDDIATRCGVDRSSLANWRRRNGIPFATADRVAIHLGMHPVMIWGRDYWNTP